MHVARGAGAAAAAADDADADHVGAGDVDAAGNIIAAVAAAVVCTNVRRETGCDLRCSVIWMPASHCQGSRTRRKPTKGPSESHQRLFGSCGSRSFHESSCTARASGPIASARVAERSAARHGRVASVGRDPLGGVAEQIEQAERIRLLSCRPDASARSALPPMPRERVAAIGASVLGAASVAARSHSASVGKTIFLPVLLDSHAANASAAGRAMLIAGKAGVAPAVVGRAVGLRRPRDRVRARPLFARRAPARTRRTCPTSLRCGRCRTARRRRLPVDRHRAAGTGTISKLTTVPAIVSR